LSAVNAQIIGTGVVIRPATDDEVLAYRRARADPSVELPFSFREGPPPSGETIAVVARAFVEFNHDGADDRWDSGEMHGMTIPADRDPTSELVAIAYEASDGLIDLLADMGIAGLKVSRLELECAPRRIDLQGDLAERSR
jgi:hypothetical protein